MILHKIPLYWMNYHLGWPKTLPLNLTISVTYNCNSRCSTCNIWKKTTEEFTLDEFKKTFKTIGKPYWTTISGGEPFMRDDLVDIVKCLYDESKPAIINIPTNGSISGMDEKVRDIADYCRGSKVIVNLSIDGIGEKHDDIRGMKGGFEKALGTYAKLRQIKNRNFTLGIHTVISKYNVKDIPEIFSYVSRLKPDSYITEIAQERVELGTIGSGISPSLGDYSEAIDFLSSKIKEGRFKGISKLTQAFRLEYYLILKRVLRENKQAIPCYAGFASGQIAPNGDVWDCCIRAESLGSLREADYDFKSIWNSKKGDSIRQSMKGRCCYCPLANASYTNMLCSPRTLLKVMGRLL